MMEIFIVECILKPLKNDITGCSGFLLCVYIGMES